MPDHGRGRDLNVIKTDGETSLAGYDTTGAADCCCTVQFCSDSSFFLVVLFSSVFLGLCYVRAGILCIRSLIIPCGVGSGEIKQPMVLTYLVLS
jgi:hypothetical protein